MKIDRTIDSELCIHMARDLTTDVRIAFSSLHTKIS